MRMAVSQNPATSATPDSWSRDAVIYEVYVRSFADSDGDGVGDLLGVASRLDYLAELGVDAVWLTPFYRSPMADGGYDVADYRAVDPIFGSIEDFDILLDAAHARGLKVIIDVVPNHCSSAHPWFQAALAAGPNSPERQRFHFRRSRTTGDGRRSRTTVNGRRSRTELDGRRSRTMGDSRTAGDGRIVVDRRVRNGEEPPNNWRSIFSGPAWTRVDDGEWYLHLFAPEQPDLNWDHPDVREEFTGILRFWLDRGVDGIRIDVAHGLVKAPGLPDAAAAGPVILVGDETPFFDQDGVHEIYREWRSIMDSYRPERIAVAEAWLPNPERAARYVRPGELHQAFNFEFLGARWSGATFRTVIDESLRVMGSVGAPTTWVMSNHDVVRHASRLAAGVGGIAGGAGAQGGALARADPVVGLRRARATALLMLALPGSVYLYQGEELGLPEVFDLPPHARQDPIFARTGGVELGRDGCRVPLPWSGPVAPYGFGPEGSAPWLPQPDSWAAMSVRAQRSDPTSTLTLYRAALRLRRQRTALGSGSGVVPEQLRWHSEVGEDILAFSRPGGDGESGVLCAVNQGTEPVRVGDGVPLIASGPLGSEGELLPDTAAWWQV